MRAKSMPKNIQLNKMRGGGGDKTCRGGKEGNKKEMKRGFIKKKKK